MPHRDMFDQPEEDVPQEVSVTPADQEAIERVYNLYLLILRI